MVSHSEIGRMFAQGATKGAGSRMFIEDGIVYSYGYHFPIAKKTKYGFIFNSSGYSSSTAKHKQHVLRNLYGNVLHIAGCETKNAKAQLDINNREIAEFTDKLKRVRSENIKEGYEHKIDWLKEQNSKLVAFAI